MGAGRGIAAGFRTDHVVVGQILSAHGARGEVKVRSLSDYAGRFAAGNQCRVTKAPFTLTITTARPFRAALLVRFEEVTDRTTAESLRGLMLEIPASQTGERAPYSYWHHDIIGLSVETEAGQQLGYVSRILGTGANDVFEVAPVSALGLQGTFLLPAVAEVIRHVDPPAGRLVVRLLPGLVEGKD